MKIFLVGMPGSGKTTLGLQLAELLLMEFVDLDNLIEEQEGKSIQQMFAEDGEDYFRQVESKLLLEYSGSPKSFVMATGGGAPCYYNGMEVINETGLSVFIDVTIDELLSRVTKHSDRPLLKTEDREITRNTLSNLLATRLPVYSRAHIVLKNPTITALKHAIAFRM
jgi:shikimate kinase